MHAIICTCTLYTWLHSYTHMHLLLLRPGYVVVRVVTLWHSLVARLPGKLWSTGDSFLYVYHLLLLRPGGQGDHHLAESGSPFTGEALICKWQGGLHLLSAASETRVHGSQGGHPLAESGNPFAGEALICRWQGAIHLLSPPETRVCGGQGCCPLA